MFVLRLRSASVEIDEKKASWHDYVIWLTNGLPLTRQFFLQKITRLVEMAGPELIGQK